MLSKRLISKLMSVSIVPLTLAACTNDSKRFGYETFAVQNSKFYQSSRIDNTNYSPIANANVKVRDTQSDFYLDDDLIVRNNQATQNEGLEYSDAKDPHSYFQSDVPSFNNSDITNNPKDGDELTTSSIKTNTQNKTTQIVSQKNYTQQQLDDAGLTTSSVRKEKQSQILTQSPITNIPSASKARIQNAYREMDSTYTIVVEEGDTLYKLSRVHGYKVSDIANQNNLSYPYVIKVGQSLFLPNDDPDYTAALSHTAKVNQVNDQGAQIPQHVQHIVANGENLFRISLRYKTTVSEIVRLNNIKASSQIYAGQVLQIPTENLEKTATVHESNNITPVSLPKKEEADIAPSSFEIKKVTHQSATETVKLRWPLSGRVIKKFSTQGQYKNEGINILAPHGTGVRAAAEGQVVYADDSLKGYGNLILIRHANNLVTAYAFNSKNLVKKGDRVDRGQIIAKVGNTGSVNQPQLHFEVRSGTKPVDPLLYLAKK